MAITFSIDPSCLSADGSIKDVIRLDGRSRNYRRLWACVPKKQLLPAGKCDCLAPNEFRHNEGVRATAFSHFRAPILRDFPNDIATDVKRRAKINSIGKAGSVPHAAEDRPLKGTEMRRITSASLPTEKRAKPFESRGFRQCALPLRAPPNPMLKHLFRDDRQTLLYQHE